MITSETYTMSSIKRSHTTSSEEIQIKNKAEANSRLTEVDNNATPAIVVTW